MKKSILFIAVVLFATTIQAQKKIKGNGKITTINRTTSEYDSVDCAGSFNYVLVAGTEGAIKIEGEENLLQYIITEVKEGRLIVKTENRINLQCSTNKTIKITIPIKDIDQVSLAGSGDLWSESNITATTLDVSLSGSGDVTLQIQATSTKAALTGSGDITLKGTTNNLDASVTGSGDFHGFDLISNDTNVNITGSGDASVVAKERLKARVSGSGDIRYKGSPKNEDSKVAGSGSIDGN